MAGTVILRGQRELVAAFNQAGKEAKRRLRDALRDVAEPVREDAEHLALETIPRIGPVWGRMRVGVTTRVVYVAPVTRSVGRADDPRRRPNFADLLMGRAMEPALERNEGRVSAAVDEALDRVVSDWEA